MSDNLKFLCEKPTSLVGGGGSYSNTKKIMNSIPDDNGKTI